MLTLVKSISHYIPDRPFSISTSGKDAENRSKSGVMLEICGPDCDRILCKGPNSLARYKEQSKFIPTMRTSLAENDFNPHLAFVYQSPPVPFSAFRAVNVTMGITGDAVAPVAYVVDIAVDLCHDYTHTIRYRVEEEAYIQSIKTEAIKADKAESSSSTTKHHPARGAPPQSDAGTARELQYLSLIASTKLDSRWAYSLSEITPVNGRSKTVGRLITIACDFYTAVLNTKDEATGNAFPFRCTLSYTHQLML